MKRLYVFDMDGTLIPNTTAMLEIAKIRGEKEQLQELERQYIQKEIDNGQFAKSLHALWHNLSSCVVKSAFDQAPKMKNISQVLSSIRLSGGISCLITAAPDFFADHFLDFGFDHIRASKPFNLEERVFKPDQILYGKDKPLLAHKLCQELSLSFEETVAFGDSISDVPLFKALKYTVAVNGDEAINSLAKHKYVGLDLLEAYTTVSGL